MYFERISAQNGKKLAVITHFLHQNELTLDSHIEQFVVAFNEQEQIVACAGLSGNIIKCVAIDERCRGEGIALKLATEIINLAYELGRSKLFIYTKPEYEILFTSCGFYPISTAYPNVVLLENSATRLSKQCQKWRELRVQGDKIGAIVMNANPFTLGHRYLIEQALAQCEHLHLFVVGENASQFSYSDRFQLVEQGIEDLSRITLHSGSDYIISRATFPNYFLKDKGLTDDLYLELDLKLFRQRIAPALAITHRFVGTEPLCAVTAEYNRKMHYWLTEAEMNEPTIEVVELERKMYQDEPISASRVRQLLKEQKWDELVHLVPQTTFHFLTQMKPN
ncbi:MULTISPECIES: [citrate (pro-3S)-lyase] ligase [Glaesserella]|uniref:[Citrate [pro-3S]-lyase] ligase n=1 Tax=Glaesserella australis TaxID=2094024 RepID=A0A328BZI6_9PAST|nr:MULTISPECIES: [citrate (pro-3S)-lyase] ligase [Glaesserella]AUI65571.1 [citrate (pro-3S)-lyase] ligase [Glaesserella sp. 15-184]RAL19768.1 [citrate (pro-3S)-lyase] ligase [Glaesserella australis]